MAQVAGCVVGDHLLRWGKWERSRASFVGWAVFSWEEEVMVDCRERRPLCYVCSV